MSAECLFNKWRKCAESLLTLKDIELSFSYIFDFITHKDWYNLSITNKIFKNSFQLYIKRIAFDISQGMEKNNPIKIEQSNTKRIPLNFEYLTSNVTWKYPTMQLISCKCQNINYDCNNNNKHCSCIKQFGYSYIKKQDTFLLRTIVEGTSLMIYISLSQLCRACAVAI